MHVNEGDLIQLRDGRIVIVTDATPEHETPIVEYLDDEGERMALHTFPAEQIFFGLQVIKIGTDEDGQVHPLGIAGPVVSDMGEVVSIIK